MFKQALAFLLGIYVSVLWHPANPSGDALLRKDLVVNSYWDEDRRARQIIVYKAKGELAYYENGHKRYTCRAMASTAPGRKRRRGDGRTPEGKFRVAGRYQNAFLLNYPDLSTATEALSAGVLSQEGYAAIERAHRRQALPSQHTILGSYLSIMMGDTATEHSRGNIIIGEDDFRWLFERVKDGLEVEIFP